ncbi:MAG: F0F1 ATP synthase subunit B [Clostridia bacterium]|nr:F0F1 ATP synthase subunit B [Clostridia bacterium]
MIQTLEIISVNLWQILISLANLLLIYIILKKLLWKPVKKVMDQRQAMVDDQFAAAEAAEEEANRDKAEWAARLATADAEADARIQAADETARQHGDRIVADARDKAQGILRQAEAEAALERQKAEAGIKQEIAAVGTQLAEKMLEREINPEDHRQMIESFLAEMGDAT